MKVTAVTAAVADLLFTTDFLRTPECVDFVSSHGLLVNFQSLLSCYDDEKVMLEDMIAGMEELSHIEFVTSVASNPPSDCDLASAFQVKREKYCISAAHFKLSISYLQYFLQKKVGYRFASRFS